MTCILSKSASMDKPDPYVALSVVMQNSEAQGVPDVGIVDVAFSLAL